MSEQFNPAAVPINYTLNFAQVNLILKGLAELPRKETDGFYDQFRSVALQTLQAAEHLHNNPPAAEPEVVAEERVYDDAAGGVA